MTTPHPKRPAPQHASSSDFTSSSISIPFEELAHSRHVLQTSYRRFSFFHVLALLPTFLILIFTLLGSLQTRELCHLQDPPSNASSSPTSCSIPPTKRANVEASSTANFSPQLWHSVYEHGSGKDSVIVTVAIAMQALIAEALRVLSFYWACCILVTALYLYSIQERYAHRPHIHAQVSATHASVGPDWAWRLSFRDPRFFVAAWSSIAWALAEFGFGAFQILHQVALYKPAEVDHDPFNTDAEDSARPPAAAAAGQSGISLLSNHPPPPASIEATPERTGNGKTRRVSASRALEQARQRLVQPPSAEHQNYGTIQEEAVAESDDDEASSRGSGSESGFSTTTISLLDAELEEEVERFFEIPVALCALWRIDAMLWSVGSSLLLSASFTHAQGALGHLSHDRFDLSPQFHLLPPFDGFGLTFAVLVVLHTIVSSLWATSLPVLGFATTTYASLLFGLAIMVAALARWGLLI
ncbi:uncharacterized protein UTRI_02519 [Ustilago trichophora]|uniref:Uncharacterized protein n=1 Tax=Ustilago trichophora TaxID=86804 RepID=A0A5C3E6B4_9BASI|nr:uncharacterized protein UTRI_02519 [Ustilago trichophora]